LAIVEIVQAYKFDITEGTQRTSFIIQKVADYENFEYEERPDNIDSSDSENNEELGTGGKFMLRLFKLTNDLKLKICKKILLNNMVEYQFHPNLMSTMQIKNTLYFF